MSILKLFSIEPVEKEFEKVETLIAGDLHHIYDIAKEEARQANSRVEELKIELALAIQKAATLSQKASDTALAAAAQAAKDVAELTQEAQAHANTAATNSSQIIVTPATPAVTATPPVTLAQ